MAFTKKKPSKNLLKTTQLTAQLSHNPVKKKKRRTLQEKTAQQLVSEADKWFSKYIRLRDSHYTGNEWVGYCIDGCGRALIVIDDEGKWKASANNGHFVTRGVYSLRFDEYNTNLQSAWCNAWRDKQDMIEAYERGLALKHGEDTVKELKRLAKLPEAYKRPGKQELLQIIEDSKTYIEHALSHPENYANYTQN